MKIRHKLLFLYAAILMVLPAVIGERSNLAMLVCAAQESQMVTIAGRSVDINSTTLDFNKNKISDYDAFGNELAQFPMLTRVELCGSNLNNEQMDNLQRRYPDIKFVWNINLGNYWTVRTDQVAFSTNKGKGPDLTNADVEQLKYCTDMVALDLGHNQVRDISFVKSMPNLRILILVDNGISDISPVAYCKNLTYIETFCNPVKDISPLAHLVNLIDINVSYNRFTDIAPLLHKPRLERLFVTHCGLTTDQINILQTEYPNAQIEYQATLSIDAGWRTHARYKAMRAMFKKNYVDELFATDTDRLSYYASVFNYEYYIEHYPDVVAQVGTDALELLYYWINTGVKEGQQASETFSVVKYYENNADLWESYGTDYGKYFMHYMMMGYRESRLCI